MQKKSALKTPIEILEAALVKEKQAHDFYEEVATSCPIEPVRKLANKLKDEESKHVRMIQSMLVQLSLGHDAR